MHYYTFNPKDYISKTSFLEPMEDIAYRRMLDHYYLTEQPLPSEIDEIAMLIRMRTHCDCIATVLRKFFILTSDGYVNDRANREIEAYHAKSERAKASANARWGKNQSKNNGLGNSKSQCETDANALLEGCERNANNKQITKNKEQINNVFLFWKEVFSKDGRTVLKGKRETAISGRLKEGYSVDEIKQAILNVSVSEYHIAKGYIDIELICRNQINLDKYIAMGGVKKPTEVIEQPQQQVESEWVEF